MGAQTDITQYVQFKPFKAAVSTWIVFCGTGVSGGNGWGIYVNTNAKPVMDISFVAGVSSDYTIKYGSWNRVALVRRSGDSKWILFVNGAKNSTTITNSSFGPNPDYTIGSTKSGGGVLSNPGLPIEIQKVAFWTTPLTDNELIALTSGKLEPENVRRSKLLQFHKLRGVGTSEPAMFAGSTLTCTGTAKAPDPVPTKGIITKPRRSGRLFSNA